MPANARRIVIVTWHFPPSEEIGGKIVWRLAKALASAGCDVRVVTPPVSEVLHRDDGYARDLPQGVRIIRTGMGRDLLGALSHSSGDSNRVAQNLPRAATRARMSQACHRRGSVASRP
jgi:hypothetical protein